MIIAFNTEPFLEEKLTGNDFIVEILGRIIKANPQHTFIVISASELHTSFNHNGNIVNAIIGSRKKNILQRFFWYTLKINKILKKYKADIFISYNSGCLTTSIPQFIIIPDTAFVNSPQSFKKSHLLFYKIFIPKWLNKSEGVITVSESCKEDIINQFKIDCAKISVVYEGINERFLEISDEEKVNVKSKYSDGYEYFLYSGYIGTNKNLLNVFKAFSAFKKRQKSNMQLIIAGNEGWKYKDVIESLRLFKFKNDVKVLNDISSCELIKIVACAYAFVYPSRYEAFPREVLQAMKAGVPVVISSIDVMHEVCADAALYVNAENFKELAVKMMLLFKDENIRKSLIEKGNEHAKKFTWNLAAGLLWKAINIENG